MKDINNKKRIQNPDYKKISKHRRKLTKAGFVAPVFMTLLNRPAWGAARSMCSISGFDSANVQTGGAIFSGIVDEDEICSDVHASNFWGKKSSSTVPERITPNGFSLKTKFDNVFLGATVSNPNNGNKASFRRVLRGNSDGTTRDIDFASLYVDAFEAQVVGTPFVLGLPDDVIDIYFNGSNAAFISAYGWTDTELDSFINYLLSHPIPG